MPIETKTCKCCLAEKAATTDFFNKKLDGLQPICRECRKTARRAQYGATKDKVNEERRAKRAADPGKYRVKESASYKANPERKKASVRAYRDRRPERVKESLSRYYLRNREKMIAQATAYAAKNPDKRRLYVMTAHWKRAPDPKYRLHRAVSAHMGYSLNGAKRGQAWESLVGYTLSDLMSHLERQFHPGMTWENYGKWHIDHILPVSSFRFKHHADVGFKECWALANLQPLWARDNIAKGARIIPRSAAQQYSPPQG